MLAENLGYGTGDAGIAKMTEDLEEGLIASDVALEALMAGMQKYDGMMDSMASETVEGLISQMQDAFEINVVRKWGQGLQDGAKKGFGTVVQLLDEAEDALSNFGDMLYEIGKTASNWVADKLQGALDKILEITDTFEFKNASLKEKISMLWNGVIVDPLKEWWENGGEQKTAETAGKIGSWMGKMLTKGLLAIFGATDVLNDGLGTEAGSSIAGSFLDGFLDNFDGQAITDAFVNAINNVWGALPWWAKILIGGYGVGKVAGGVSSVAGGIANFIGGAKNVIGSATSMTGLLGFGSNAAIALGAGNLAGGASLSAGALSALGLGATAGGVVGGVTLIKGFSDLHKAVENADNLTENHAYLASGGTAIGGVAAGAGIGAAIGSVVPVLGTAVGALIGAGIGGIAGWVGGEKWAANIRAAQFSSEEMQEAVKDTKMSSEELAAIWEKAVWKRARDIFGDIELSTAEINTMSRKIVLGDKVTAMDEFASAASQAEASLQSLQSSVSVLDRWNWKAGLGLSLTDDEQESYVGAIDSFINNAKSYLESQQYEFTAAVKLLMDTGEGSAGAGIISSNDAFYAGLQEQVAGYSTQLQELLSTALENGNLGDKIDITIDGQNFTVDEQSAIEMLQEKIAAITNSINAAEEKAQLDMIEIKFKRSTISHESYQELQAGIDAYMETALGNLDEAQLAVLTNLNLQLDKATTAEEKAKIQEQINQTLESYGISVDEVHANVNDFVLDLAVEKFSADDLLGPDALSKIEDVLSMAVIEGIKPGELTGDDITRMLGLENFDAEAAQVLANILNNLSFDVDEQTGGKIAETVAAKVDELTPEVLNEEVTVYLSAVENIINSIDLVAEEFGIHPAYAEHILWELSGEKSIENRIDILCNEFGIEKTQAEEILWKLTGRKQIDGTISPTAADFGIKSSYSYSPLVQLTPRASIKPLSLQRLDGSGQGYRGGIFGGDSAMGSFARGGLTDPVDGIVGGSTRYIRVNEESPEMIIPLSDQRRGRALKLWAQAGNIMGVPGFARGGIIGGNNTDEGFRFKTYGSSDSTGGRTVQINMGGVRFEINVSGSDRESVVEAIKAQAGELADYVVGLIADALETEFENTPVRGGA